MPSWIAVVDDDISNLKIIRKLLNGSDIRVSAMRTGRDFLSFVKDKTPDLVLMDILMPGMDGFETYERLRMMEYKESRDNIPVIFLTSDNDDSTEKRCLEMGAADFVRKPFSRDVLVHRIRNVIGRVGVSESSWENDDDYSKRINVRESDDLKTITQIYQESADVNSALWVGEDAFISVYRFLSRFLTTYQQCVCKMLFTLSPVSNKVTRGEFAAAVEQFGGILTKNLRRSDILMQYNFYQFFVVLPELSEKYAPEVIARLRNRWENDISHEVAEIKVEYDMMEYIEPDTEYNRREIPSI